ncbi:MAG: hypothetical protein L0H73_16525 [Nitrococcus sp.]|nr:hypothetical protein [Nitrococcus sp.]
MTAGSGRWRAYRKRQLKDGFGEQLSMVVSVHAKRALERVEDDETLIVGANLPSAGELLVENSEL